MTPDIILRKLEHAARKMLSGSDQLHLAVQDLREQYKPHDVRARASDDYASTAHKLIAKYQGTLRRIVPDDELALLTQARRRWLGSPTHGCLDEDKDGNYLEPTAEQEREWLQAARSSLNDAMINFAHTCYDALKSQDLNDPILLDPQDIESIYDAERRWGSAAEQLSRHKSALKSAEARERGELNGDKPDAARAAGTSNPPRMDS